MLSPSRGSHGVGFRRVIVLAFALGAALSVSAPASSLKLISAETIVHGEAQASGAAEAVKLITRAIVSEQRAIEALDKIHPGMNGSTEVDLRTSIHMDLRGSEINLEDARAAFPPVSSLADDASQFDKRADHYDQNFSSSADDRAAVGQIVYALGDKRNAVAVAEADVAAHSIPPSTAKPGECRGFDPDQIIEGMGEGTIAVDGCDRVQIEVEDGTQPLTGVWGAKTASGFADGSCGHVGVMLECTTPAGASAAVVVFGSPLKPGTEAKIVLKLAGGSKQTLEYRVPNAAPKPPTTTTAHPPAGKIVKLEVGLSCGGIVSDPVAVTNPTNTKPVIYVAQFKPHPFCGSNSQYLIDAATGKKLPDGVVIFPPNTTAYADQYECSQHPELDGCTGQGPDSQVFVFGLTVTNPRP
jgi:hypothetical protein